MQRTAEYVDASVRNDWSHANQQILSAFLQHNTSQCLTNPLPSSVILHLLRDLQFLPTMHHSIEAALLTPRKVDILLIVALFSAALYYFACQNGSA